MEEAKHVARAAKSPIVLPFHPCKGRLTEMHFLETRFFAYSKTRKYKKNSFR